MAQTTAWMTSADLLESVKRKISFPSSQITFTDDDILAFANEEMAISQVPSVLSFHEEYFVQVSIVPLVVNQRHYPIPDRAIGMRLRGVFWQDLQGNIFDMARVSADDKAFWQNNVGYGQSVHKFYLEGNNIVLTPHHLTNPTGNLYITYFLRPNLLVQNDQAAIISSFQRTILILDDLGNRPFGSTITIGGVSSFNAKTITNIAPTNPALVTSGSHGLNTGDTIEVSGSDSMPSIDGTWTVTVDPSDPLDKFTIPISVTTGGSQGTFKQFTGVTFTEVVSSPAANQFVGDFASGITASNLANAINLNGTVGTATVVEATGPGWEVIVRYVPLNFVFSTSVPLGFFIQDTQGIVFQNVPASIVSGSIIDFLQTKPGHRTKGLSVTIPTGGVLGNVINFTASTVPRDLIVGDYICLEGLCIIPQIPPDLHNGLAERTGARILAALGDSVGLQNSNAKIEEINKAQGTLLDNRDEGNPKKITARHSLLRYGKQGTIRRV